MLTVIGTLLGGLGLFLLAVASIWWVLHEVRPAWCSPPAP